MLSELLRPLLPEDAESYFRRDDRGVRAEILSINEVPADIRDKVEERLKPLGVQAEFRAAKGMRGA